jgi:diguanylate cyclase (GGDEF)-like protein
MNEVVGGDGGLSPDKRVVRPDPTSGIHHDFWLRHLRIGFSIFLAETAGVMAYLAVTPHGPHRTLLWVMAGFWLVGGTCSLLLAPFVASRHWAPKFSASWTVLSAVGVGVVALFDGGIESPLIYLLFLPIANAALAFTPVVAAVCGLATLGSAAFVVAADSDIEISDQNALLLFAVLAGVSALSVAASINRMQREQREQELRDQIATLAATDGLTGCAVHRVFYERLDEEIARSLRFDYPLSLMLIDVDTFKSINDTYGHLVGDQVLAGIGSLLRTHTRSFDLVGRLGGDEFAVLMAETEPTVAAALAERIRREVAVSIELAVTLSIGVSGLDRSTPTAEHMVDDADFALYQVKGAGRDGVAVRYAEPSTGSAPTAAPRAVIR